MSILSSKKYVGYTLDFVMGAFVTGDFVMGDFVVDPLTELKILQK